MISDLLSARLTVKLKQTLLGLDKPKGLMVIEVAQGSPAEDAAIAVGDVILEANQHKVDSTSSLKKNHQH